MELKPNQRLHALIDGSWHPVHYVGQLMNLDVCAVERMDGLVVSLRPSAIRIVSLPVRRFVNLYSDGSASHFETADDARGFFRTAPVDSLLLAEAIEVQYSTGTEPETTACRVMCVCEGSASRVISECLGMPGITRTSGSDYASLTFEDGSELRYDDNHAIVWEVVK